jgi:hypothetical protein
MKRRVVLITAVAVAVAVAAIGITIGVATGGNGPRLSADFLASAEQPCADFTSAVEPLRVGAGFDDLVRQTTGFATARTELAAALSRLATSDDDRAKLEPLLDNLAAGTGALEQARRLDGNGDTDAAFRRLDDFTRLDDAEGHLTKRLGLGDCG